MGSFEAISQLSSSQVHFVYSFIYFHIRVSLSGKSQLNRIYPRGVILPNPSDTEYPFHVNYKVGQETRARARLSVGPCSWDALNGTITGVAYEDCATQGHGGGRLARLT